MKRVLVLMLLAAGIAHVVPAAAAPVRLQSRSNPRQVSQGTAPLGSARSSVVDGDTVQRNSIGGWWNRTKQALHHLSGCTLASAGITYAFIAGVAIPGAGLIGLAGAGVVVAVCL